MTQGATVIIIDDSATSCHVMETILHNKGYRVKSSGDGREGLTMIMRELPHCVILDVVLPSMSGYEVCRHLRANKLLQGLPVIMVSTKSTPLDKSWALRQGATHYLVKPFEDDELVRLVNETTAAYEPPVHQEAARQSPIGPTARKAPVAEIGVPVAPPRVEEISPTSRYQTYGKMPAYRSPSSIPSAPYTDIPSPHFAPLHKLIPLHVQGANRSWDNSPAFLFPGDESIRKLYEAIDGRNDIETICSITALSREDVMRGLRSLLSHHHIRLREPNNQVVRSTQGKFEKNQ